MRIATATCLVASGLLVGGAGAAIAIAEPALESGDSGAAQESPERDTDDRESPDEAEDGVVGREEPEKPDEPDEPGESDEPGAGEPTDTPKPEPTETQTPPTDEPEQPEEPEQPGSCEDDGDDCEPGWPWWPWPWPRPPGDAAGSGGGGRAAAEAPSGRPDLPPAMQLPAELLPRIEPDDPIEPVAAAPGVGVPPGLPLAPITLPVVVAPTGLGAGAAAEAAPLPSAPQLAEAEAPPTGEPPPATGLSNASGPATSYRAGYTDYLRTARMTQVVALAAPGLAGMLVLTGVGGLVGYRQAKAGHAVRTGAVARFAN